jgi:hypothetical protein
MLGDNLSRSGWCVTFLTSRSVNKCTSFGEVFVWTRRIIQCVQGCTLLRMRFHFPESQAKRSNSSTRYYQLGLYIIKLKLVFKVYSAG